MCNGVFTRVFVDAIRQRGVSIDEITRNTRSEVARIAKTIGHEQVPAVYDQTIGKFYFIK